MFHTLIHAAFGGGTKRLAQKLLRNFHTLIHAAFGGGTKRLAQKLLRNFHTSPFVGKLFWAIKNHGQAASSRSYSRGYTILKDCTKKDTP